MKLWYQNNHLFCEYIELLTKWNTAVNLVQGRSLKNVFSRHIEDSLQLTHLLGVEEKIIDIGTGAGFPGVVLTLCGFQNVVLCEKNFKKVLFLQEVLRKTGCSAEIFADDIYKFSQKNYVAVARGFGRLILLLDIMIEISSKVGFFHKGEKYKMELAEAKEKFLFAYDLHDSLTNDSSVIIVVYNVVRKKWV